MQITRGMTIMIIALVFLIFPGILYNNFAASGLTPSQVLTCPGADASNPNVVDDTCQGSVSAGCQQQPSQCTLNGVSVSFLSASSPFTPLLSGNIFGFFSQLTSHGSTASSLNNNPFLGTGTANYFYVNCGVTQNGGAGLQKWAIAHCSQTDIDSGNLTEPKVNSWPNWNPTLAASTKNLQFFNLGNASFPLSCSFNTQLNYTAVAGNGWTYYGCTVCKTSCAGGAHTNQEWTWLIAVNNQVGGLAAGYNHRFVYAQVENWYTQGCSGNGLGGLTHSDTCDQWARAFNGYLIPGTTTQFVAGPGSAIFVWLIGLALFIIGLGINFSVSGSVLASGGGAGVGFNRQGTKLAQVLGLGLMFWVPLYSQFSVWFTSGNLPNGLDGTTGIVSFFVTGAFFFGAIWTAFQEF